MSDSPAPTSAPPPELVVLRQDNGELQEDEAVPADRFVEPGRRETDGERSEDRRVDGDGDDVDEVDEESEESFPASDPPSHWTGPSPAEDPGSDRLVERRPSDGVTAVSEGVARAPGTLPKEETGAGDPRGDARRRTAV
jgi:hypothetical protein